MIRLLRPPPRRAGFTLTELAIVLGVVSLIIGAIWEAYSSVNTTRKVAQAVQQINAIASNIRGLYSTRGSFSEGGITDTTSNMASANVFPPDMMLPATAPATGLVPQNPWNGAVKTYVMSSTTFRVSYYNVTAAICAAIASQLTSSPGPGMPIQLITAGTNSAPYLLDLTTSVTLDQIVTQCNYNNAPPGTASVEFDFLVR